MAQAPQPSQDSILGRLVVDYGLALPEEVQQCLEIQRKLRAAAAEGQSPNASLETILVQKGVVTQRQLKRLKAQLEAPRGHQPIPGYQIQEKLGSGAMGTVYKARQLSLDRTVAIKVLPRKYINSPEFVQRFYAEGRAAAKLNHPNIVGALDVGKVGDTHYFVMEFVEGHTVYDEIASGKVFSEPEALNIVIQVAKALDHAHKAGFIHRDVKPKNIMITKDGTVKLADMGLARAVSDREAAEAEQGKAYGTPYYISPEQIRGELDVDYRADIYSLGATFYHMVTGRVPFEGANPSAVMHKHLKSKLTPPDQLNPSVSSGVGEIIEVCMAKDREKRYASAADLLEDLQSVMRGEPPMQARRMFDLASLAQLEPGETRVMESLDEAGSTQQAPYVKALVWAAASGWLLAMVVLVILILTRGY